MTINLHTIKFHRFDNQIQLMITAAGTKDRKQSANKMRKSSEEEEEKEAMLIILSTSEWMARFPPPPLVQHRHSFGRIIRSSLSLSPPEIITGNEGKLIEVFDWFFTSSLVSFLVELFPFLETTLSSDCDTDFHEKNSFNICLIFATRNPQKTGNVSLNLSPQTTDKRSLSDELEWIDDEGRSPGRDWNTRFNEVSTGNR